MNSLRSIWIFLALLVASLSGGCSATEATPSTDECGRGRDGCADVAADTANDPSVAGDTDVKNEDLPAPGTFCWSQVQTSGLPEGRYYSGAVFDAPGDRVLWFGGANPEGSPVGGVLALDMKTNQWNVLEPAGPEPEARAASLIFFDQARRRLTLFGGEEYPDGTDTNWFFSDIWTLTLMGDLAAWELLSPDGLASGPSRRKGASGIFDSDRRRLVIHGGGVLDIPESIENDTWIADLASSPPGWARLPQPAPPMPRRMGGCAWYHDVLGGMVMAGGGNFQQKGFNDAWFLPTGADDAQWTAIHIEEGRPLPFSCDGPTWDPRTHRGLAYGGGEMHPGDEWARVTDEVWSLDVSPDLVGRWERLNVIGTRPPPLTMHSMVYDSNRDRFLVLLGAVYDEQYHMTVQDSVWALSRCDSQAP